MIKEIQFLVILRKQKRQLIQMITPIFHNTSNNNRTIDSNMIQEVKK